MRTAEVLRAEIDDDGASEIARRSRGTPRVANRLLRRIRDFAQVKHDGRITREVANQALELLDVDNFGLDDMDARILRTIIEKFDGGPVGVNTIAAAIAEDPITIEEVYEPFLVQNGFLQRSPRGASPPRRRTGISDTRRRVNQRCSERSGSGLRAYVAQKVVRNSSVLYPNRINTRPTVSTTAPTAEKSRPSP